MGDPHTLPFVSSGVWSVHPWTWVKGGRTSTRMLGSELRFLFLVSRSSRLPKVSLKESKHQYSFLRSKMVGNSFQCLAKRWGPSPLDWFLNQETIIKEWNRWMFLLLRIDLLHLKLQFGRRLRHRSQGVQRKGPICWNQHLNEVSASPWSL